MTDADISKFRYLVLSGKEFVRLFPTLSTKLFKLTNETEKHRGLQLKTGLNRDIKEFNPYEFGSGIHFTDINNLPHWINAHFGENDDTGITKYYRSVVLPPHCKVYIGFAHFKADAIILREREEISNFPLWSDEDFCVNLFSKFETCNCEYRYIKIFNKNIMRAIVKYQRYINYLKYIRNESKKMEIGFCFDNIYIKHDYIEKIIKDNIDDFKNLLESDILFSEDIQLLAAKYVPGAAEFFLESDIAISEKIQLALIKQEIKICDDFDHNHINTIKLLESNAYIYDSVKLRIVQCIPLYIRYMSDPSEDIQLEAIKSDYRSFRYIKNPSEKAKIAAVKKNYKYIRYIKDPSKDVQLAAIKKDYMAISYIRKPRKEAKIAALKENYNAIAYIRKPSKDIQLEAIEQNWKSIKYIDNPCKEVQLAAVRKYWRAIEYIVYPYEDVFLESDKNKTIYVFLSDLYKSAKKYFSYNT